MYEIRIHGRGGQGVKTTAYILGRAGFLSGFKTQDFAIYGAERRGAPVTSFCRMDKQEILSRGYIFEPDAIIVLDHTISENVYLSGVKDNSVIIVNSPEAVKLHSDPKRKVYSVDATSIALKNLGKPIPNAAILGGFLKVAKIFSLDALEEAIKVELQEEGHAEAVAGNIKACEECLSKVKY